MQPRLVITLIHGTFANNAPWINEGSVLREAISRSFGKFITFKEFNWSGNNSLFDRSEASTALRSHIVELQDEYPDARQRLIAHSHRGNVATNAISHLDSDHNVLGVACISTPFLDVSVRHLPPTLPKMFAQTFTLVCLLALLALPLLVSVKWWWTIVVIIVAPLIGWGPWAFSFFDSEKLYVARRTPNQVFEN